MQITLQRKDGSTKTIEVNQTEVVERSILVYDNVFYVYGSMSGNFFQEIRFNEVQAPLYLNK